jgi:hypothetical protein
MATVDALRREESQVWRAARSFVGNAIDPAITYIHPHRLSAEFDESHDLADFASARGRGESKAAVTKRLQSDSIVQVCGVGRDDDQFLIEQYYLLVLKPPPIEACEAPPGGIRSLLPIAAEADQ